MDSLKNILLTGLVISELMGADVIIDPYKGLNYDIINSYDGSHTKTSGKKQVVENRNKRFRDCNCDTCLKIEYYRKQIRYINKFMNRKYR